MCQVDYQRLSFVGHFVLKSPELVCVHANWQKVLTQFESGFVVVENVYHQTEYVIKSVINCFITLKIVDAGLISNNFRTFKICNNVTKDNCVPVQSFE